MATASDKRVSDPIHPIQLGIVGCGFISHTHAESAQHIEGVRFAACTDRDISIAQQWAQRYGCDNAYDDMSAMLQKMPLDGVLLATWPTMHRAHVQSLIDAGARYILCEKPLTMTGAEAADLWREATRRGTTIIEAFIFRHHPVMQQLERLLAAGEYGAIDTLEASFQVFDPETAATTDTTRNWRQMKEAGGGAAYDLTSYCVHAVSALANSLPQFVSFTADESPKYGTISRLHGFIRYRNGVVASIQSSRRASFRKAVSINCEHASLEVPVAYGVNIPPDIQIHKRSGNHGLSLTDTYLPVLNANGSPVALNPHSGQQHQLQHFRDVIRGHSQPRIPLIDSVVNMFTIDAMIESAKRASVVEVNLPDDVSAAWQAVHERNKKAIPA